MARRHPPHPPQLPTSPPSEGTRLPPPPSPLYLLQGREGGGGVRVVRGTYGCGFLTYPSHEPGERNRLEARARWQAVTALFVAGPTLKEVVSGLYAMGYSTEGARNLFARMGVEGTVDSYTWVSPFSGRRISRAQVPPAISQQRAALHERYSKEYPDD